MESGLLFVILETVNSYRICVLFDGNYGMILSGVTFKALSAWRPSVKITLIMAHLNCSRTCLLRFTVDPKMSSKNLSK